MRFLKTNTATIVTVGPFYDKADGVTIETGLTITNERISATVDLNDGSAPTLVLDNITGATSGTANDLNYITNCDAGLMQIELAAANVNYLGRFFLTITDAANHVPVFHEFTILPALVYDALIAGTDTLQVHAIEIANNLITAAAINDGAIDAATFAAGAINAAAIANDAIDLATFAADVKTGSALKANVETVTAGAITAAAIANGAIDAATFAADVDAEILSYLVDDATRIDASALNTAAVTSVPAILADTGTDGVVVAAASKTGYTLAATTGLGNQTANITGNLSGSVGSVTGAVGSVTGAVGSVTGAVGSVGAGGITAASIANAAIDAATFAADVDAEIATMVWNAAAASYGGAGTYGQAVEDILTDTNELQADDTPGALSALETHGDSTWATATGFSTHDAADVWAVATRALTDKADFALSSASRDAIWDQASALTLSFEALLTRAYQMINNKMNVTDADGVVALRNIGDTGTIATGSVTDNSTTTTRLELTWV